MVIAPALVAILLPSLSRSFSARSRAAAPSWKTVKVLPAFVTVTSRLSTDVRKATSAALAPVFSKKFAALTSTVALPPSPTTSVPPCKLTDPVETLTRVAVVAGIVKVPLVAM